MKKVVLCIAAVVILISLSFAQEEVKATKDYIPLAKGNFWEYSIKEMGEEKNGKMEITEEIGEGRFRVKVTNMGRGSPESLEFCVEGDFFCWKMQERSVTMVLHMLKFGAKKGDSWTSSIESPEGLEEPPMTFNSTIAGLEEVTTSAGVFKDCLRVVHTMPMESGTMSTWFAKDVGMVRLEGRSSEGEARMVWTLTKYKVIQGLDREQISKYLKESETALLVEVTSVTDIKPEKEGEAVTKVKVAAKVEKSFKGESSQTELSLEMAAGSIKTGKYVLFFKKGEKGDVIVGEPVEATENALKAIENALAPPPVLGGISDASLVIAGKVVTCEDRGTFKYYVVEVIKALKGEKKDYIDVYRTEGLDLESGNIYLFALKAKELSGRSYFEPTGKDAVVLYSSESEKKVEELLKAGK